MSAGAWAVTYPCAKCHAPPGRSCGCALRGERREDDVKPDAEAKGSTRAHDAVNHPAHYTSSPAKCCACGAGIECIDIAEHHNFCLGSAIKYLWRAGLKNDHIEDLRKSVWYITREIARLERGGSK